MGWCEYGVSLHVSRAQASVFASPCLRVYGFTMQMLKCVLIKRVSMDRRTFIGSVAASGLATASAGCLGFGGDDSTADEYALYEEKDRHELGQSIEYGGLQVTVSDPVLADHFGPYDCGPSRIWEDEDAARCSPPEIDDFEDPPTQGGQFMALQVTMEHVGERRISLPYEAPAFDLVNAGYAENHFLIEDPWVAAQEVFPSWVFFVDEYDMNEQGVFPGVGVRGYIAFEVPIQADLDEMTAVIRWEGSEPEEEEVYWDITADDVEDLTDAEADDIGGDVFYEPRAGGVDWGEHGHPEGEEPNEGVLWNFDGDGEYHVPDSQRDDDDDDDDEDTE